MSDSEIIRCGFERKRSDLQVGSSLLGIETIISHSHYFKRRENGKHRFSIFRLICCVDVCVRVRRNESFSKSCSKRMDRDDDDELSDCRLVDGIIVDERIFEDQFTSSSSSISGYADEPLVILEEA